MPGILILIGLLARTTVETGAIGPSSRITADPVVLSSGVALSGREEDARVASIAFRLATAGRARCPVTEPVIGIVLHHLSQYERADRAGMIATQALDRGPGVIAVVPDSPAYAAGIRPGDVLLAIDGRPLPSETGLSTGFDARTAHARADAINDLLGHAGTHPSAIALSRNDRASNVRIVPLPACPSRVHLARSGQRNAYADGRHVFLTTGLLMRMRSDDELAFVIAHEMAHNILGHARVMRGSEVRHGLGRTLGRSGRIVRDTERDADTLAGELMLDAGYDPVAGAGILERLDKGDLGIALFSAHEPAGQRIAAMRKLVQAR